MLQVLIRKKISPWLINNKNPWEIEDLLTAVVLGSCEYAGLKGWRLALEPFLAEARDAVNPLTARKLGDRLPSARTVKDIEFAFWPDLPAFDLDVNSAPSSPSVSIHRAIPEVIICLKTKDGRKHFILIEVKLNIGKSTGPSLSGGEITDQLAKYWKHLQKIAEYEQGTPLAVVYVTPWSFPQKEMDETRDELTKTGETDAPIFWISWRDFVPAVESKRPQPQGALPPIIRAVCKLMEDEWNLVRTEIERWPTAVGLLHPRIFSIEWQWANLGPIGSTWAESPFVVTFEPPLSTCVDRRGAGWQFSNGEGSQNDG